MEGAICTNLDQIRVARPTAVRGWQEWLKMGSGR